MASSSSKRKRSYDVFLSFRGPDVRNGFAGYLYNYLDREGINTYIDSEELEKGEKITRALMEAIEESQIAIVVFSENYASSSFCLEELATIMERRRQNELIVWPVFYKVEPREVRTPRGIYQNAMAKHEMNREKVQKVQRWREALSEAGELSGSHFIAGLSLSLSREHTLNGHWHDTEHTNQGTMCDPFFFPEPPLILDTLPPEWSRPHATPAAPPQPHYFSLYQEASTTLGSRPQI